MTGAIADDSRNPDHKRIDDPGIAQTARSDPIPESLSALGRLAEGGQEMTMRCRLGLHSFEKVGQMDDPKRSGVRISARAESSKTGETFVLIPNLMRCKRCHLEQVWLE